MIEVVAPPDWRCIDFISDLHLAEATPLTFAAWREYLSGTNADAVFILGDLFEAWVGDDSRFGGFEARAADVLRTAAARRPLAFMVGNRDFLLGKAMLDDCGVRALPDPCVLRAFGQRALLTHGDAWCLADIEYQQIRRQVRDPAWQAQALAQPLELRRKIADGFRAESERHAAGNRGAWADVDVPTALQALHEAQAATLIHGHTHRPGTNELAPGAVRHVLSDWDLDHGARAEVLRWHEGRWDRLAPAAATTTT
jgi:UDP-2,3-diacylglucosamine hydrolase